MTPMKLTQTVAVVFVTLVLTNAVDAQGPSKTFVATAFQGTNTTGPDFIANATSGPPLQVSSTAQVNNLNVDFLNGLHASAFAQTARANTFSADQTFTGHVTMANSSNANAGGAAPLHAILTASTCGCPAEIVEASNTGVDVIIDFHSASREAGNVGVIFSDNNPRFAVAQNTSQIGVIPVTLAENGGNVGIGTAFPTNILTVKQNGGHVIADGYDTYSSARWKTNIQTYPLALNAVMKLRGVMYNRKVDGKPEIGVIAEEVASVIPEVVSFQEGSAQGVDYSRLTAVLIQAVKEQQEEITRLKARVDSLTRQ